MKTIPLDQSDIQTSFLKIFNTYYPRIVYFSFQFVHNREEAEDIAQDTFETYWSVYSKVSTHETAIKNYLYSTAKNLSLNHLRHQNIINKYQDNQLQDPFDPRDILNAIISAEISAILFKSISTLPKQCREIAKMAFIKGLKNQEIADLLGISPNTVRAQKQRAIQLLKERMNREILSLILFIHSIL